MSEVFSPGNTIDSGIVSGFPVTANFGRIPQLLATSAAADGSFWLIGVEPDPYVGRLEYYNFGTGEFDLAYAIPTELAISNGPQALAAVDDQTVFFIASKSNATHIFQFTYGEDPAPLPDLPQGETPQMVAAASDGSLWTVGSSGTPYAFDASERTWAARPCSFGAISLLSAGSQDFVLGLADGKAVQWSVGQWTAYAPLSGSYTWLAAGADGSTWSLEGESLTVRLAEGASKTFSMSAYRFAVNRTAASGNVSYFLAESADGIGAFAASFGVLDQPGAPWLPMNAGEKLGYDAITNKLGLIDPQGVRGEYGVHSHSFDEWQMTVSMMTRPADVSSDRDWLAIQKQIVDELGDVVKVNKLFTDLATVSLAIATSQLAYFDKVKVTIDLPKWTPPQQDSIVGVIFGSLVNGLVGEGLKAIPGGLGIAARLGVAAVKNAAAAVAKKHGKTNLNEAVAIKASEIYGTLGDILDATPSSTWDVYSELVSNWGRLKMSSLAANSAIWNSGTESLADQSGTTSPFAKIGQGVEVYFYQLLMPIKWQISFSETVFSVNNPPAETVFPPHAPAFALLSRCYAEGQQELSNKLYWWYICTEVGSDPSPNTSGPFPNPALMQAIFALGVVPQDFFDGQNGWCLPVETSAGTGPVQAGAGWSNYSSSTKPVG